MSAKFLSLVVVSMRIRVDKFQYVSFGSQGRLVLLSEWVMVNC